MPAQKKYKTAKALEKAINNYFMRISSQEPIYRKVLVGHTNKGKPRYDYRETYTEDGERITCTVYHLPPSIAGLCLHLGISRMTWSNYSKQEGFAAVVAHAKLRIEAYLTEEIMTRDRVEGVKFNLSYNYGWKG